MDSKKQLQGMSRRRFLALSAGSTAALALAACAAPGAAPAGGGGGGDMEMGEVSLLKWTSFVEAADETFTNKANAWGEANNTSVTLEMINNNEIAARIAAAISAGDGPDIIQQFDNWGHLFEDSLVDVSDVAEGLSDSFGGYYEDQIAFSKVGDSWRTVPWTIVGNSHVYRTDWWEEVLGRSDWGIDTWDDYIETAAAMKDAGYPFGNSAGQSFGDPVTFWYSFLWGHGGTEVNEEGSAVAINSDATLAALNNAITLNDTGFIDGVVSWDDGSNNRAYLGGEVSCTLNGASIYFVANRDNVMTEEGGDVPLTSVSNHGLHPAGPAGRYSYQGGRSHGVMNYSSNVDAAKGLLTGMSQPEFYDDWLIASEAYNVGVLNAYNDSAVWDKDEKLLPYKEAIAGGTGRWPGFPGPSNAASFDVRNNYYVVDMFAKTIAGQMSPEEAAEWAASQIGESYGL